MIRIQINLGGHKSNNHKFFQKLPPPVTITNSQIKSSYQSFYDKLLESYNNNNFLKVNALLEVPRSTSIIPRFSYPLTEGDTLLTELALLLYKITTTYPVKYYKTQISAGAFLNDLLFSNKEIPGLVLDIKPFIKIMNYYFMDTDSNFISGMDFTPKNSDLMFLAQPTMTYALLDLQPRISQYFLDDSETKIDGLIVKTNTTEQLIKKYIPHISTSLFSNSLYLTGFNSYLPPIKGRYKQFIEYFLYLLKDPKPFKNNSIITTINKIVTCNIEDDFSWLFPFLFHLTSDQILTHQSFAFLTLSDLLISLFISPPTRQGVLDLLESFFISFKSTCHPSVTRQGVSDMFVMQIVTSLCSGLKKLAKKKKNKIFFNMDEKLGPSQEEIHKLLSMTSEINIMNIRNCFSSEHVLIETTLDPLLINRYFDIAFQCIDLTDAFDVARSGWTIMSALCMHIDKNEKIRDNFENIFQIATNNLYRLELKDPISEFLMVSFLKVPFNREKTVKGLENTDFCKLAISYFSNLLTMLRSIPSAKDEAAQDDFMFGAFVSICANELFKSCESEIFDELLQMFISLAFDEDIAHCNLVIELIVSNYCHYASNEQAMKVVKAFQRKLEHSSSNLNNFRYLSTVNSTILSSALMTKEAVKKSVDLLLPYTKSENEQMRKVAWSSIQFALSIFDRIINVKVSIKPDKMEAYPLENARIEDFDISFKQKLDVSDIDFEVFDPIFEKLLEMKDPYELNAYFGEVCELLALIIKTIFNFTEGATDQINEVLNNSVSFVPELIKKSVPIKDKFFKCLIRIIHDFPEKVNLIHKVIMIATNIFNIQYDSSLFLISKFFISFGQSKKNYNSGYLYNILIDRNDKRKEFYIYPLSEIVKNLIESIIELTISSTLEIREESSIFVSSVMPFYSPFIIPIIEKIIEKRESIPMKDFISFLSSSINFDFLTCNDKLFCQVILFILKNFESNEKDIDFLESLKKFMLKIVVDSPFETPSDENLEYINLLNEIEKNYISKTKSNRSFQMTLLDVIIICLKHVKNINDNILCYIIHCIVHYDHEISRKAEICLSSVLERRTKFTKERVEVKKFPTISSLPNILDRITVKYPENGCFFPLNVKSSENEDKATDSLSAEYSIDINPTTSVEINIENTTVNEDIIKVFDTYKKLEIEVNISEEEKLLYDSEFFFDQGNGFFMFKDHYHHKKYEFSENKMLLKIIPDIFASAINAINEKSLKSSVSYSTIWSYYALTVGPFCTKKLSKISRKYLSEYLALRPEVTAIVLYDMMSGFLKHIFYWEVEDRLNFIKLVLLPNISVISTSHYIDNLNRTLFLFTSEKTSPFCLAPIIKVMFDLSLQCSNSQHFNRCFVNNISNLMLSRQTFFFSSIDQIKDKFILPFVEKMSDYKMNEIGDISFLFFRLFDCCTFISKMSPMYSSEILSKANEIIAIFEQVLHKENINDCLIYFLVHSFRFFQKSSFYSRLLIAPVFTRNLHIIFQLLKSSGISTEESFVLSFRTFIENDIFFSSSDFLFDFLSSFIREMMNSPLPLQQILLENINSMLEANIFSISKDDYEKFEELFIRYGRHEKLVNFGNELRMKIAKILGIFEIRKSSVNKNFESSDEKVEDEVILKAASIILNAYLFDRVDERVTDALEVMERLCSKNELKNKIFFKSVLEVFVHRHSGHVINEVEEILIQYKYMMTPSYIC